MSQSGTVKWFSDSLGYGFIGQKAGPDVYVHHSVIQMDGYRTLRPGMKVTFEAEERSGSLTARRVAPQY